MHPILLFPFLILALVTWGVWAILGHVRAPNGLHLPLGLRLAAIVLFLMLGAVKVAVLLWTPGPSPIAVCHLAMADFEGYGPWRFKGVEVQATQTIVAYHDGYNGGYCYAQPFGPIWIAREFGQSFVSCSLGLGGPECPRRAYGVIP